MKRAADNPAQPTFSFVPQITPLGNGEFRISAGRPMQWVRTRIAARALGVAASTLRGYVQGYVVGHRIPEKLKDGTPVFRKAGVRSWEFNLAALEQVRAGWTAKALL